MRASKTCAFATAIAATLAIVGVAVPAAAQTFGNDPLPVFKVLAIYKEVCPKEHGGIVKSEDEKLLAAHQEDLMKFEVARVRAIRPTVPDPDARKALATHMDAASRNWKARFTGKCDSKDNTTPVTNFRNALIDPAKIAELKKSIETGVPYDKPRKVSDAAGAPVTFTTADLGKRILEGPLKGGKACAKQEVTAIELISRKPKPVAGQAPHMRVQQEYVEDWSVTCDGEAKRHRITFTQDDRAMRGQHHVEAKGDAKKK